MQGTRFWVHLVCIFFFVVEDGFSMLLFNSYPLPLGEGEEDGRSASHVPKELKSWSPGHKIAHILETVLIL